MQGTMLKVEDLWVSVDDKQILKGVNFSMKYGEINVLFGPNGAGKTTLMMTLMGFPRYRIEQGKIYFKGQDVTDKDLYERARVGLGVSFQRPPTVKGVTLRKIVEIITNNEHDIRLGGGTHQPGARAERRQQRDAHTEQVKREFVHA